jgi:hypothetical protein
MNEKYYRVIDSFDVCDRWCLGTPKTSQGMLVDPRSFTEGRRYEGGSCLQIPVKRGGMALDFTLGAFDMPVVLSNIACSLKEFVSMDIEWVNAKIDGYKEEFEIANVLTMRDAINEDHSEITRWTKEDGLPSRIGEYAGIGKLVLNRSEVKGASIFRLKGWELPLLVSYSLVCHLKELEISGVRFEEIQTV